MNPVADMTELEKIQTRAWIRNWAETGPLLEAQRDAELRVTNTVKAMLLLDDAFASAVWMNPPRPTSGLVEQQEIYARAR